MLQLLLIVPLLGALYLIDVYIQPIGFGLVNFSELFNLFLCMHKKVMLTCLLAVPVAPRDEKASRRLTKQVEPIEKEAFSVSPELKDILIGLLLGDLYAEKQKASKNARLQFKQSTAHIEYLDHLYDLFKEYYVQHDLRSCRLQLRLFPNTEEEIILVCGSLRQELPRWS